MKKWLSLILSGMLVCSLAACGSGGEASADSSGEANVEQSKEAPKEELTFDQQVLIDTDQVSVTVTGIDPDGDWGYTLDVLLENKSPSVTYAVTVDSAAVDGVTFDPLFSSEIAPGKKANDSITFSDSELEDLLNFTDIELDFRIHDSNDWSADPIVRETHHIYPFGEEKAVPFVREAQDTDTVLVDNDMVSVIATGYDEDNMWGYTMNLYLVNKTDKELMYSLDEVSVNGFMMDPLFADSVRPGNTDFSDVSWSSSDFETNGVTEVSEIDFKLTVYDANNWTADHLVDETIHLTL